MSWYDEKIDGEVLDSSWYNSMMEALRTVTVEHHTDDDVLTKEETHSVHTNLGASGAILLTLPQDAEMGTHFTFVILTAQELRIDPGLSGAIYINGARQTDDKYISADDEAESVLLICLGGGDWAAVSAVGTWSVES